MTLLLADRIEALLRVVPDFPEPGILFRDITPFLADGPTFAAAVAALASSVPGQVDLVVGIESRGFVLAAPIAVHLGTGVGLIRKAGKLPGPTVSESYALEYGTATVELNPGTVSPGMRVLVVDDVLATGGTAAAAVNLLLQCEAEVVQVSFLAELLGLGGRSRLGEIPVNSLLGLV